MGVYSLRRIAAYVLCALALVVVTGWGTFMVVSAMG